MKDNDELYDFMETFYSKMTTPQIEAYTTKQINDKLYKRPILGQTLFAHYKSTRPQENLTLNMFSRKLSSGGYSKKEVKGVSAFCVYRIGDENEEDEYVSSSTTVPL